MKYFVYYIPTFLGVALSISAYLHSLKIDELTQYRNSILIPIEFILLLGALLSLFVIIFLTFVSIMKKNGKVFIHCVLSIIATIIFMAIGFLFDSATLLYIT